MSIKWLKTSVLLGISLWCHSTQVICEDPPEKKVTAVYIEGGIVLDGNLDEPEWNLAQPATDVRG